MNLMRVAHWLTEQPLAQARLSTFVRLHQVAAQLGRFASNITN